jgi:hypothetical protein
MSGRTQPDHSELLFALGAMHSDIKHVMEDVAALKIEGAARMDGHSRRIGSLETTRVRLVAYAAGLSAGIFTVGSVIKDKFMA